MSQVGGDSSFVAQVVQASFDTLRSTRDPFAQSGHCLALGCLHRYVGGMGSGQHLQTSVSVLHSLSQDAATPSVQVGGVWEVWGRVWEVWGRVGDVGEGVGGWEVGDV